MKRKMTRLIALLIAIIMCIPNSITALAAEVDATTEAAVMFMATISGAEHGTITFTGQTGDSRQYNKGETVDVILKPDQGYQVSRFKVTNKIPVRYWHKKIPKILGLLLLCRKRMSR